MNFLRPYNWVDAISSGLNLHLHLRLPTRISLHQTHTSHICIHTQEWYMVPTGGGVAPEGVGARPRVVVVAAVVGAERVTAERVTPSGAGRTGEGQRGGGREGGGQAVRDLPGQADGASAGGRGFGRNSQVVRTETSFIILSWGNISHNQTQIYCQS